LPRPVRPHNVADSDRQRRSRLGHVIFLGRLAHPPSQTSCLTTAAARPIAKPATDPTIGGMGNLCQGRSQSSGMAAHDNHAPANVPTAALTTRHSAADSALSCRARRNHWLLSRPATTAMGPNVSALVTVAQSRLRRRIRTFVTGRPNRMAATKIGTTPARVPAQKRTPASSSAIGT